MEAASTSSQKSSPIEEHVSRPTTLVMNDDCQQLQELQKKVQELAAENQRLQDQQTDLKKKYVFVQKIEEIQGVPFENRIFRSIHLVIKVAARLIQLYLSHTSVSEMSPEEKEFHKHQGEFTQPGQNESQEAFFQKRAEEYEIITSFIHGILSCNALLYAVRSKKEQFENHTLKNFEERIQCLSKTNPSYWDYVPKRPFRYGADAVGWISRAWTSKEPLGFFERVNFTDHDRSHCEEDFTFLQEQTQNIQKYNNDLKDLLIHLHWAIETMNLIKSNPIVPMEVENIANYDEMLNKQRMLVAKVKSCIEYADYYDQECGRLYRLLRVLESAWQKYREIKGPKVANHGTGVAPAASSSVVLPLPPSHSPQKSDPQTGPSSSEEDHQE